VGVIDFAGRGAAFFGVGEEKPKSTPVSLDVE